MRLDQVYKSDCATIAEKLVGMVDLVYADILYKQPPTFITLSKLVKALKPGGAIWVQTDPSVVDSGRYNGYGSDAILRLMLDSFKTLEYVNQVIWSYDWGGRSKTAFGRKHDVLLYFVKKGAPYKFNAESVSEKKKVLLNSAKEWKIPTDVWPGNFYTTSKERIKDSDTGKGFLWQKPLWILQRIVDACTDPNDVVFEPYLGSGPACVVAKERGRHYIGCDISAKAVRITKERLK